MKRITVRLSDHVSARMASEAAHKGVSRSKYGREVIAAYLASLEAERHGVASTSASDDEAPKDKLEG